MPRVRALSASNPSTRAEPDPDARRGAPETRDVELVVTAPFRIR